jgi:hypothetical protein
MFDQRAPEEFESRKPKKSRKQAAVQVQLLYRRCLMFAGWKLNWKFTCGVAG